MNILRNIVSGCRLILISALCAAACLNAAQKPDVVVSQDGTGDYSSIQSAIDAAPERTSGHYIILIKKGIYREKILIEKNFIMLLGEDKDSTRIIYPELRSDWRKDHPGNDWGAAVVNISNKVTDLLIANLSVYNNFGSVHGGNGHQFAIRGGGTRVIILNCIIKSDGGDTVSLWNTIDGMYYLASCYFEGWVDYVCPRGWCFIKDSRFFGHNLTASIWHDGSSNKDQKFVIKNSTFDGVPGFSLGRNHRDGQFYLIDCRFSSNMADKPIFHPSPDSTYRWGNRVYYFNCHRDSGDYKWFSSNLEKAPGNPEAAEITAAWAFAYNWNPEEIVSAIFDTQFKLK